MYWTGQIDNLTELNQRLILIVHPKNAKKGLESAWVFPLHDPCAEPAYAGVDMDITFTTTMEGSNDPEDSTSWSTITEEEK